MPKKRGKREPLTEEEKLLQMQQRAQAEEEMAKKKEEMLLLYLKVTPPGAGLACSNSSRSRLQTGEGKCLDQRLQQIIASVGHR